MEEDAAAAADEAWGYLIVKGNIKNKGTHMLRPANSVSSAVCSRASVDVDVDVSATRWMS